MRPRASRARAKHVAAQTRAGRFLTEADTLDPAPERVLPEVPVDRDDACCHFGGSVAFGPDGNLFVSIGDNTTLGGTAAVGIQISGVLATPSIWLDESLLLEDGKFAVD